MAFNKVVMMGNLTDTPEIRQTTSGVAVTNFCIAVQRKYKAEGQPDADFFYAVAWGKLAETITRYFVKGKGILVCGYLQNKKYTDKNGIERVMAELTVEELSFVGNKADDVPAEVTPAIQTPSTDAPKASEGTFEIVGGEDELPF